jgi:hypothetical protein
LIASCDTCGASERRAVVGRADSRTKQVGRPRVWGAGPSARTGHPSHTASGPGWGLFEEQRGAAPLRSTRTGAVTLTPQGLDTVEVWVWKSLRGGCRDSPDVRRHRRELKDVPVAASAAGWLASRCRAPISRPERRRALPQSRARAAPIRRPGTASHLVPPEFWQTDDIDPPDPRQGLLDRGP